MTIQASDGPLDPPWGSISDTDNGVSSGPASAISECLAPLGLADARDLAGSAPAESATERPLADLVATALDASYWAFVADNGDAVADYLNDLAPMEGPTMIEALGALQGPNPTADSLYAGALQAFRDGKRGLACYGFAAAHAADDQLALAATLALAMCALHDRADSVVADLTSGLVAAGANHPRVFLTMGIAMSRIGELDAAKKALARAARAARKDTRYIAEQHAAQRVLLGLQFGTVPTEPYSILR